LVILESCELHHKTTSPFREPEKTHELKDLERETYACAHASSATKAAPVRAGKRGLATAYHEKVIIEPEIARFFFNVLTCCIRRCHKIYRAFVKAKATLRRREVHGSNHTCVLE